MPPITSPPFGPINACRVSLNIQWISYSDITRPLSTLSRTTLPCLLTALRHSTSVVKTKCNFVFSFLNKIKRLTTTCINWCRISFEIVNRMKREIYFQEIVCGRAGCPIVAVRVSALVYKFSNINGSSINSPVQCLYYKLFHLKFIFWFRSFQIIVNKSPLSTPFHISCIFKVRKRNAICI